MGSLLYIIAFVLLTAWLVGFVVLGAGGQIHVLLGLVVLIAILQIIPDKRMA